MNAEFQANQNYRLRARLPQNLHRRRFEHQWRLTIRNRERCGVRREVSWDAGDLYRSKKYLSLSFSPRLGVVCSQREESQWPRGSLFHLFEVLFFILKKWQQNRPLNCCEVGFSEKCLFLSFRIKRKWDKGFGVQMSLRRGTKDILMFFTVFLYYFDLFIS